MTRLRFCTTSWDDGHPLDLRIAELLVKYGLQGTFYVPVRSGRPMLRPSEIRQLSTGFEIGAHTLHHEDLTRLPAGRAKVEITAAKHRLEDLTSKHCLMFSFPYGRYRRQHLGFARDAGYAGVRTTELMSLASPRRDGDISVMPTTIQTTRHTAWAYVRNASRRFAWRGLASYVRHARSSSWEDTARSFVSLVVHRGGVFHLWGHAWEVEEQGLWRELEEVLRLLAYCAGSVTSVTNAELLRLSPEGSSTQRSMSVAYHL